MRLLLGIIFCLILPTTASASLTSQLYTGDAFTVSPGKVQLRSYYNSSFGGPQRVVGGSFTFGATKSVDAKLSYGYLWNNAGQDVRIGPNIGVKWRFIGDGVRKPSAAVSTLYAINEGIGGESHKNDFGSLLIVQYPVAPMVYLANFGHVWVGDEDAFDLRYVSFAAGRFFSGRRLGALEYSQLSRLGRPYGRHTNQVTAAFAYSSNESLTYTGQLGYLWSGLNSNYNLTLGISLYL
ncbi:hypothetical protein LLG46_12575 [bacterium]|nr:hypothetical protein [bacterium]